MEGSDDPAQKSAKLSLEDLSKDELIHKCKALLLISKKAKAAKDELSTEVDRLKHEEAKAIRTLEEERNEAERQTEVLQEMVVNLTENKMTLVTKNESILRQLNVLQTEVDSMKQLEHSLVEERKKYFTENDKLKHTLDKQQDAIEKMREKTQTSTNTENSQLMDEIHRLKNQLEQLEKLKEEYKHVLDSKETLETQLQHIKTENNKIQNDFSILMTKKTELEDEKCKLQHLFEEVKASNIILEEKFNCSQKECLNLKQIIETHKQKLCAAEDSLKQFEQENMDIILERDELKNLNENLNLKIDEFENNNTSFQQEYISLNEALKQELQIIGQEKNDLDIEVGKLREKNESLLSQLSQLEEEKVQENDTANSESEELLTELKIKCDDLESENKKHKNILQELNGNNEEFVAFCQQIKQIVHLDEHAIELPAVLEKISNLHMENKENNEKYNVIKSQIFEMFNLFNESFGNAIVISDDNVTTILNLLLEFSKRLSSCCFVGLCDKYSVCLEDLFTDLTKLESALNVLLSNEAAESVELLQGDILSKSISQLIDNCNEMYKAIACLFKYEINLPNVETDDLKKRIDVIPKLILKLTDDKMTQESSSAQLKEINAKQKDRLDEVNSELKQNQELIFSYENQLKEKCQEFEQTLSVQMNSSETLNQNVSELNTKLESKEEELLSAFNEIKNLQKTKLDFENIQENFEDIQTKLVIKDERLTDMELSNAKLKADVQSITIDFENIKKEKETLNAEIKRLQLEINEKESDANIRLSMQNALEELDAEKMQLLSQMDSLRDENIDLQNNLIHVSGDLEKLTKQLDELKQENCDIKCELEKNEFVKSNLEAELESKTKHCDNSSNKIDELKHQITETNKTNLNLQSEKQQIQLGCDKLSDELNALKMTSSSLESKSTDFDELNLKLEDRDMQIQSLNEEKNELFSKIQNLESHLLELENGKVLQEQELNSITEQLDIHKLELQTTSYEKENLEKQLESLTCELDSAKTETDSSKSEFDSIKMELENVKTTEASTAKELDSINNAYKVVQSEKETLESQLLHLQNINENLSQTLTDIKTYPMDLDIKYTELKEHSSATQADLENARKEMESLKMLNESLDKEKKEMETELTLERGNMEKLKAENENLREKVTCFSNENEALKTAVRSLEEKVTDHAKYYKSADDIQQEVKSSDAASGDNTTRDKEILAELNQMNDAIRVRGEAISNLENTLREKEEEIEKLKKKLLETGTKTSETGLKTIEEEEKSDTERRESERLTDNHEDISRGGIISQKVQPSNDTQSEIASTSTFSKMEETTRMKDLEDTFEERYVKLKNLAVKLKKKSLEQTKEIVLLQETKQKLVAEKEDWLKKNDVSSAKTIQALQVEIDRLQDNLESTTKEKKELEKQLFKSATSLAELRSKLSELEEENSSLNVKLKEYEKNIELTRELRGYEIAVEDLQKNVKEMSEKMKQLEENGKLDEAKIIAISQECQQWKLKAEERELEFERLQTNLLSTQEGFSNITEKAESLLTEKQDLVCRNEALTLEIEEHKLMTAKMSSETSQHQTKILKQREVTEAKLEACEGKLKEREVQISELEQELNELKTDFEAYKVRAQSVLRSKARLPQENVDDMLQENKKLCADFEAARLTAHQLRDELTSSRTEISYLKQENERLRAQLGNVNKELSNREASYKVAQDTLKIKLDTIDKERLLEVKKIQNDSEKNLNALKLELKCQKDEFRNIVDHLEKKIELYEDKIWHLQNPQQPPHPSQKGPSSQMDMAPAPKVKNEPVDDIFNRFEAASMEREDAEGSEWVEPRLSHSPMEYKYQSPPLEQLISNPVPQGRLPSIADDVISNWSADVNSRDIMRLESKLSASEFRIQQLSALLADSEAENAKLVQLSDTLKEDIRRSTRNEDREKHLQHNEYMKNVILKFSCLPVGDEKFQLVSVLKTLLQLSPEEASKLAIMSKGEDPSNASKSWGGYLHLWSGR